MSVVASSPTSVATTSVPSDRVTVIWSAPSTTCWFVMITPSARTTNPVPKLCTCCSLPSGAKNMSKGDCCTRRRPTTPTDTTDGATLAAEVTMAVRRDWSTDCCAGGFACASARAPVAIASVMSARRARVMWMPPYPAPAHRS